MRAASARVTRVFSVFMQPRVRVAARVDTGGEGAYLLVIATEFEEIPVTNKDGSLTARQTTILNGLLAGKRHKQIAREIGTSLITVRQDVSILTTKMGCPTSGAATAQYATALAYREAAHLLLAWRTRDPIDETEEHVNHVLDDLAGILRERAELLLPQ